MPVPTVLLTRGDNATTRAYLWYVQRALDRRERQTLESRNLWSDLSDFLGPLLFFPSHTFTTRYDTSLEELYESFE